MGTKSVRGTPERVIEEAPKMRLNTWRAGSSLAPGEGTPFRETSSVLSASGRTHVPVKTVDSCPFSQEVRIGRRFVYKWEGVDSSRGAIEPGGRNCEGGWWVGGWATVLVLLLVNCSSARLLPLDCRWGKSRIPTIWKSEICRTGSAALRWT